MLCAFFILCALNKDVYKAYFNSQKALCVRNRALIPGDNAVICSESMLFLLGASEYAKWHMIMFWRRKTLLKYSYFLSETWGWAGSFATEGWKVRCKKRRGRSEIQIHESSWARSCRFLYPLVLVCLAPYLFFFGLFVNDAVQSPDINAYTGAQKVAQRTKADHAARSSQGKRYITWEQFGNDAHICFTKWREWWHLY